MKELKIYVPGINSQNNKFESTTKSLPLIATHGDCANEGEEERRRRKGMIIKRYTTGV